MVYQWRRNGAYLADSNEYSGTTSATLTILDAQSADAGIYDVVVFNPAGVTLTEPAEVQVAIPCNADVSPSGGDGVVNVNDLLAVINSWGSCAPGCPPSCTGDVTNDCLVNVNDLLAVINNWGACP